MGGVVNPKLLFKSKVALLFTALAFVGCQKSPEFKTQLIGDALLADREVLKPEQRVYLIELSGEPLLALATLNPGGVLEVSNEQDQNLQKDQKQVLQSLQALSSEVQVLFRYKYVLNGVSIVAPTKIEEQIKKIQGVKSVRPRLTFSNPGKSLRRPLQLAPRISRGFNPDRTSVTHLEAQAAYDQGLRGQKIRVGVIDSGIDYTHSMLGGSGRVEDYEAVELTKPSPHFPNQKVVGGIDLVGEKYDIGSLNPELWLPKPDVNPMDEGGHGTHVAGTIAGLGDGVNSYDGVAPEALLYAIKVFGTGSTTDEVVIAALEWSVDPNQDGVLDDKLHVVNLSLGGSHGTPYELYNKAVTQLSQSGTVVVASAGNSDNIPFIVSSPSTSDEAFSVAALIDGSEHNWLFRAVGFYAEGLEPIFVEALEGQTSKPIAEAGDVQGELIYAGLAAEPFTEEESALIKGKVALMDRGGGIPFQDKIARAAQAGAVGAIIAQNEPAPPFTMGGSQPLGIPAIMISLEIANKLKAQMEKGPVRVVFNTPNRIERPELIDQITDFSSRGPRSMDYLLKPEITAPGQNIISASMGEGTKAMQMSGTSMSGPHVAGVMALMKQKYPRLSSRDLKSLVMSTAKPLKTPKGQLETVARQGAGLASIRQALNAQFVSNPVSLSLGLQSVEKRKTLSRSLQLKSLWDDEVSLKVSLESSSPAVTLAPVEVVLKPLATAELKLNLTVNASQVAGLEEEITGWIVLRSSETRVQRIPFLMIVQKVADVKLSQVELGAESKLELEGATYKIHLENKSEQAGEAWAFNLLGLDSRKAVPAKPFMGRECDLKAVGYRLNGQNLEVGVKFFNRISTWALCEVSLLFDADQDQKPEAELALTVKERIPGLSGLEVASTLVDYPKARALRKKAEEESKVSQKEVVLDLKSAILHQNEALASNLKSVAILRVPLKNLRASVGMRPSVQVVSTALEPRNSEMDDYLGEPTRWRKLSLEEEDQAWLGLQSVALKGRETRAFEGVKGAGRQALVLFFPGNLLDSRALHDEQMVIYRPDFGKREDPLPLKP